MFSDTSHTLILLSFSYFLPPHTNIDIYISFHAQSCILDFTLLRKNLKVFSNILNDVTVKRQTAETNKVENQQRPYR